LKVSLSGLIFFLYRYNGKKDAESVNDAAS
jgi:hypothetical protein